MAGDIAEEAEDFILLAKSVMLNLFQHPVLRCPDGRPAGS
jgi:hypothetical protein